MPLAKLFHKITDKISCSVILHIMLTLSFMCNYMLRVNISLAVVEMVQRPNETAPNKFEWDKHAQNHILGSFFVGYVSTQLLGGRLSETIGSKRVMGTCILAASILTAITPFVCHWGYRVVVGTRALLGLFLGPTFPSIYPLAVTWVPPFERSRFTTHMMGTSLGAAITMPLGGLLINTWGWESVFYFTGAAGIVWALAWFYLVYDSPAKHPRISQEERHSIESKIGQTTKVKRGPVPWVSMITSPPVWAFIGANLCATYGFFTMVNQLPTYMRDVLKYNIKESGLLTSLPYVANYIMGLTASYCADRLIMSRRFSTASVRKIFCFFSIFLPGCLMLIQTFYGYDRVVSLLVFTGTLCLFGSIIGGYIPNALDIAPYFSATLMGMANTIAAIGGWASTFVVAAITGKEQTFERWRYVFAILAGMYFFGFTVFAIFGRGELQPWSAPQKDRGNDVQEMEPLEKKP